MKARFKFEIMNNLGTILQDEEFKVAYYILNRLALEDTNRVKIYRAMLADLTGKSERTISRITDKLDEKGVIKKDTVSDSKNRYNYYSIHPNIEQLMTQNDEKLGHEEQETTPNLVTDDRFNKNKTIIKIKKEKELKEKDDDIFVEFQKRCDSTLLECKTENELLSMKTSLSTELRKKQLEIPRHIYCRCLSYLNKQYDVLSQVVTAEASTDNDFEFLM